jgi:hypothetical protein
MLPDRLEPATSPRHRAGFHSAAVGILAAGLAECARAFERRTCEWAAAQRLAAASETDVLRRSLATAVAWIAEFLGSAVVGAFAGYVSHLAADSSTPLGIPLI